MEEPVIIKQGNKYGVKIHSEAPSIHMIRANIETEIAPIVGSEQQANDLVNYIKDASATEEGVWGTNIFGKSIEELVTDGMRNKIVAINDESQSKLRIQCRKLSTTVMEVWFALSFEIKLLTFAEIKVKKHT